MSSSGPYVATGVQTFWIGNEANIAQVDTITVTGVATGGTLTATINSKVITYTCVVGDTVTTAAANWVSLLASSSAPAEFGEINWSASSGVITATAATAGKPFTVATSSTGGATVTHVFTQLNVSQNDVGDAKNWLRNGVNSIPQTGDDVVVANSTVSLLYNLTALASVQFNSFTRWQNFTGVIGLPVINASGYYEYRPTYFQFSGPTAASLPIVLGTGSGNGPSLEKYNVGSQLTDLVANAAGSASGSYSVYFLGTNGGNTTQINGVSVACCMNPGETSTLTSATVTNGGTLDIGTGCTFTGNLQYNSSTGNIYCLIQGSLSVQNASTVTVASTNQTYSSVAIQSNSSVTWESNSTITTLTLQTTSTFNAGSDPRGKTVVNCTVSGDTCQILDPASTVTFTNPVTVNGQVVSGFYTFAGPRTFKVV